MSSDSGGSKELVAGGEEIEAAGLPGAKQRGQGHLGGGALGGAGAPTDLAGDHEVAEAALGGVVVAGGLGIDHEGEPLPEVALQIAAHPVSRVSRIVEIGCDQGVEALLEAA